MNYIDTLSLLCSLSVATATLGAQGARVQAGVATSLTVPTGAFHATSNNEGFNQGWQGVVLVALNVGRSRLGIRADGTYGAHNANDHLKADLTAALGQPADEKIKLLGGNFDLTYTLPATPRVKPYLLGGPGLYHVTVSVTSGGSTGNTSGTEFAWNVGGGITYRLGSVAGFLEARYVDVAALSGLPRTKFLPITAGIRFGAL